MKKILVLGAPVFQIEVIQKAKKLGYYVGVIDVNENAPAFPYADETFCCNIRDFENVLRIAKDFDPNGILIGACDTSVVTGAKLCHELNLPGNTIEAAIASTDKVKMLETFKENNVEHPSYQVVKKNAIKTFDNKITFPLITKPVDSSGGRGVHIVHNSDELYDAALFSSESGLSGDILVEEYMSGPEVSVEVIVREGIPYILQITDKLTSGEPNFFEVGHSQPSTLSPPIKAQIRDLASRAVIAVGLKNSPAHVEIIVTDNGPKLVELGSRLGGDCITSYLIDKSVSGIDMTEAAINLSLGILPDLSHFSDSGICSAVHFIPATEGTLTAISGVDIAEKMPGVLKIKITCKVKQYYSNATDDTARFGYVVCEGDTSEDATQRCLSAIDKIQFKMYSQQQEVQNE